MGRQDVLITMFIFGAMRIVKAGFTQRKVMHHIYQHSSLRIREGWIFSQDQLMTRGSKKKPKGLNVAPKSISFQFVLIIISTLELAWPLLWLLTRSSIKLNYCRLMQLRKEIPDRKFGLMFRLGEARN